jgi:hypothetical protein
MSHCSECGFIHGHLSWCSKGVDLQYNRQVVNVYVTAIPNTGFIWEYVAFDDGTLYKRRQDTSGGPSSMDTKWKKIDLPPES